MKIKDITLIGLMIALSFILSYIKFFGSIALDSLPAFLALLVWKDRKTAYIAAMGHMFTAISSGFPFGMITHILIALLMFVTMWIASILIVKSSQKIALLFVYISNALIMPLCIFIAIDWSLSLYITLVSALSVAVVINIVLALVLYRPVVRYTNNA